MNERLMAFLKAEQLSPAQFADFMGVQRSGVSHLLAGRNKPGFDFFAAFLQKFPAANVEWLISGRGKMYKDAETKSLFPDFDEPAGTKEMNLYGCPAGEPLNRNTVTENPAPPAPPANTPEPRRIEKVVILYSDGTFSDFIKP
jgi:transcriptional regulator with XRE-family HTH domain